MPDFARFDTRGYPTVSVREGYRDWAPTYEATVEDAMDLALLEQVESVAWNEARPVAGSGPWGRGLTEPEVTPTSANCAYPSRGREHGTRTPDLALLVDLPVATTFIVVPFTSAIGSDV